MGQIVNRLVSSLSNFGRACQRAVATCFGRIWSVITQRSGQIEKAVA